MGKTIVIDAPTLEANASALAPQSLEQTLKRAFVHCVLILGCNHFLFVNSDGQASVPASVEITVSSMNTHLAPPDVSTVVQR